MQEALLPDLLVLRIDVNLRHGILMIFRFRAELFNDGTDPFCSRIAPEFFGY